MWVHGQNTEKSQKKNTDTRGEWIEHDVMVISLWIVRIVRGEGHIDADVEREGKVIAESWKWVFLQRREKDWRQRETTYCTRKIMMVYTCNVGWNFVYYNHSWRKKGWVRSQTGSGIRVFFFTAVRKWHHPVEATCGVDQSYQHETIVLYNNKICAVHAGFEKWEMRGKWSTKGKKRWEKRGEGEG